MEKKENEIEKPKSEKEKERERVAEEICKICNWTWYYVHDAYAPRWSRTKVCRNC